MQKLATFCYDAQMKSMHLQVPFYANFPDEDSPGGSHCVQATYKSILKYYFPEDEYTWEELDSLTGKVGNLATWEMAGLVWLAKNGFEVERWSVFDYERFIQKGFAYLREFDEDIADYAIKNTNLELEVARTKEMLKKVKVVKTEPTLDIIKKYVQKGYLVRCGVNARVLNNEPGYTGHSILVTGFSEDSITLHDPGLPAFKDRKVSNELFERAFAYGGKDNKEMDVIKLKQAKKHAS